MKICCKCRIEQSFENFSKSRDRADGYNPSCKSCDKEYRERNKEILRVKKKEYYSRPEIRERDKARMAKAYAEDKDRRLSQIKDFYKENRDKYLLVKCRERCKKSGIECSIQLEDIVIPEFCPVLGIRLTSDLGKGQLETNASLDRIDPTKGYIPGNVQIISRKANTMKSNATYEELKKFGEWCAKL